MTNQFLRQLPRYESRVEISALRIHTIIPTPRGYILGFDDQRFAPQEVSREWMQTWKAVAGGYFAVRDDGTTVFISETVFAATFRQIN